MRPLLMLPVRAAFVLALLLLGSIPSLADAALIDLVGDRDCFGLGGSCPDGSLYVRELGGDYSHDYREPGDPAFTDHGTSEAAIRYLHSYDLEEVVLSAELEIRTVGMADDRGPWDVYFNDVLVGQFATNESYKNYQQVVTHLFSIPGELLTGSDTVRLDINVPTGNDAYIIDYAELRAWGGEGGEGGGVSPVPEPDAGTAFAIGLLLVLLAGRRLPGDGCAR